MFTIKTSIAFMSGRHLAENILSCSTFFQGVEKMGTVMLVM